MNSLDGPWGETADQPRKLGRYEFLGTIGRGGMGEVLKAIEPVSQRIVAVKVLDAEAYHDEELLGRFKREAQSAMTLDHVNIAKFYGLEEDQDGRPMIIMEFIDGMPMDQLIKSPTMTVYSTVADYMIQTARGLENAYRRSIIHRDIKPSNLIVTPEGIVKIIDFGLAKSLWDNTALTGSGMVVGTPRYISPEQGMGRSVDHRSDIYSLGATLYELLTHQTPFDGDTPLSIMMKHINSPLVPPYMLNPQVPADMSEITVRMMAKDPKERYQDYEPLIRDLETAKIHRMAKERRFQVEKKPVGVVPDPTRQMDELDLPEVYVESGGRSASGAPPPSSYLTEGLVNVDFSSAHAEPPPSRARLILFSLTGFMFVVIALIFLLRPAPNEPKDRTWLGSKISSLIEKSKAGGTPTATELAQADQEKVSVTTQRMEAIIGKVLRERQRSGSREIPTVRQLRSQGIVTDEESQDGWGNDLYITDAGGSGVLVALGRDGTDKTDDDFQMYLDGSHQIVPPALTAEDLQVSE